MNVKFSDFANATNASYPTPVGLQGGANVRLPVAALARAIQDAIAVNVNFPFTGNLSAANLSGTNTGDETTATLIAKGAQIVYQGTATGTNTYAVTATPIPIGYVLNLVAIVTFTNANSGASTLNLNGLGAKAIQFKGVALTSGAIPAGATMELKYDGTQFQIVGAGGGTSTQRFPLPFGDSTQSTKYDSTTKLIVGQKHFDPATSGWNLQVSSTATLYCLLGTTNVSIAAAADLYFVPDVGSPSIIATLPTTTSLTAALVSVSVSTYFNSTSAAGTFQVRVWISTFNFNDQCTCYGAWIEVNP